jgi:heme exporter protein A
MLTAKGLAMWRGDQCLFRALDFAVPAGSATQVTGPNGSGKTTLLRVIAGFLRPETGTLAWEGEAGDWDEVSRGRVAYCGHLGGIKAELTATENLRFDAALAGADPAGIPALLEDAGLGGCAGLRAGQLSAGQRRRLALARLGLSGAKLWLLDEPQTNLDDSGRHYLRALLAHHLRTGGGAVIASHEPAGLADLAAGRIGLGR